MLNFLIFKTSLIPKMIIFINKIDDVVKIAIYLCLLLLLEDQNWEEVLI